MYTLADLKVDVEHAIAISSPDKEVTVEIGDSAVYNTDEGYEVEAVYDDDLEVFVVRAVEGI